MYCSRWQEAETGRDGAASNLHACLCLFACACVRVCLSRLTLAKLFPKYTLFPHECLILLVGWVGSCAPREWMRLPQKRLEREEPNSRSVCILPFAHQTGPWGDCTSWHYCVLVNGGPVTDPQTHWPRSVIYPSHGVQALQGELLIIEAFVILMYFAN